MIIVPALLEQTTADLIAQLQRIKRELPDASHVHIDIMDGVLVTSKNNIDPAEVQLAHSPFRLELHFMVNDPLEYMRAWRNVDAVFRVLYHIEAETEPLRPASFARREGWEVGLVLNPETSLSKAKEVFPHVDVAQFMTVHPGQQGAPLVPEVVKKIEEFTSNRPTCEHSHQPVVCAADGHITTETITTLRDAGVEIFNVGSTLIKAGNLTQAYNNLLAQL